MRPTKDYYYFEGKAPKTVGKTRPKKKKQTESVNIENIPLIRNKYNIHGGGVPHIPVPVENIPEYFTEDSSKQCVWTIRTIGIVRRLEHEVYIIESTDKHADTVQVPLSRGTNRQIRVRSRKLKNKKKIKRENKHKKAKSRGNKTECSAKPKTKDLPFPDSVQDPLSLGDTRVKDGGVYLVLGRLQWYNSKPIIDVHRFILVHDLKSTYESFMLQYAIARCEMDFYKAHLDEIREIVRKPNLKRKRVFVEPEPKKFKRTKKRKIRS